MNDEQACAKGGSVSGRGHERESSVEVNAELVAIRERLRRLENEENSRRGSSGRRSLFGRRKSTGFAAVAIAGVLLSSGVLFAQKAANALFVDKNGNVGVGTAAPRTALDVAGTVTADGFATSSGLEVLVPVGTISAFGGDMYAASAAENLKKRGWLPCDGSSVTRKDYATLFAAIGTSFGAPDADHFNLPDLRGRFLRGTDHGLGLDKDASSRKPSKTGGNAGDAVGSVEDEELKNHRHPISAAHADKTGGRSSGDPIAVAGWPVNGAGKETEPSGGKETRPTNVNVNWIIFAAK